MTLEGSLELARSVVEDGTEVIAATPHVRHDYPTGAGEMETAVADFARALEEAGIPLEVRPGGEIALDRLAVLSRDELRRFGLGGNEKYLLVETPYSAWPLDIGERLFRLRAAGVTPVLAHPERNPSVQADPERVRALVESGTLVQLTAASVDGRLGRRAQSSSLKLLGLGLAHLLASDAHAPAVRAAGLSAAAEAVGDKALAGWLTVEMPGAILAGAELPPRPGRLRSRRFFG